jgi:hypothetical protein
MEQWSDPDPGSGIKHPGSATLGQTFVFGTYEDILQQCCGAGMFYPGSGSLTFLSRFRGLKKHRIQDLGSRILLYIKIGMKKKPNFFLAFYSFKSKFY